MYPYFLKSGNRDEKSNSHYHQKYCNSRSIINKKNSQFQTEGILQEYNILGAEFSVKFTVSVILENKVNPLNMLPPFHICCHNCLTSTLKRDHCQKKVFISANIDIAIFYPHNIGNGLKNLHWSGL